MQIGRRPSIFNFLLVALLLAVLGGAERASAQCAADINRNGIVGGEDLAVLLGHWGTNNADADINGNNLVEGGDLLLALASWGLCDQANDALPTTLYNYSSKTLNVYVFGITAANVQSYMDASGNTHPYTGGPVPSVATLEAANGSSPGTKIIRLPRFSSYGRVYFSEGTLSFAGWEQAPSYNHPQLFDFVEYTYPINTTKLTTNTSSVDAFSLPITLQSTPILSQNVSGWTPPKTGIDAGRRAQIFAAVRELGDPWVKLIVKDVHDNDIRLLAPWRQEALNAGFPNNYLDQSITNQWGRAITINTYGYGYYTAQASTSNQWIFTPDGSGPHITFEKPTSTQAFQCVLTGNGLDAAGRLNDILSAGLNRGTLLNTNNRPSCIPFTAVTPGQPDFNPENFYKITSDVPAVNQYSKILHQYSLGGSSPGPGCTGQPNGTFAFGFAADNEGNASSTLTNTSVTHFTITVSSF